MSERITPPSERDKCNWASGGGAYPNTDPGAPVRDVGFQPKDYPVPGAGAIIPAEDHNFLWRLGMEMLSWIRDIIPRDFTQVAEGIAAYTTPRFQIFRVCPFDVQIAPHHMSLRLAQLFNASGTATTGGNVLRICTDGEQIYYISGATGNVIIAADPEDGSEIWESAAGLTQATGLCTDGNYVYANATVVDPGLRKIDRTSGAAVSAGGTEYACSTLKTNGEYAVGIRPSSSTSKLVYWTVGVGAAAPSETGTTTITPLNGLAIDEDQCYVGGTRATYDVWAWTLSTRINAWQITLPMAAPPTVSTIAADGDFVYVGSNSTALSAGGNASIYCLERVSGALLWTMDLPDIDYLSVDDRYLYAIDSSNDLYQIRLRAPIPAVVAIGSAWLTAECDGVSVIGADSTTPTDFKRHWCGGPTKTFMRADGADPARRPFYTLAVPVDGRI